MIIGDFERKILNTEIKLESSGDGYKPLKVFFGAEVSLSF